VKPKFIKALIRGVRGTMDIRSDAPGPAGVLSNFTPNRFCFRGEWSESMEGFLQSLKFEDETQAREVRGLIGRAAKERGASRDEIWQKQGALWFQGKKINRFGQEYQTLLDEAFRALFAQSEKGRAALLASDHHMLTHLLGGRSELHSVLTSIEFCRRLDSIRRELRHNPDAKLH
jgi:hypothetical protein